MSETRRKLLEKAQQYGSVEEFREKDQPGYLLARKYRVINLAFPSESARNNNPGIFYLYRDNRVIYIGMSEVDARNAMMELVDKGLMSANHYKIFHPLSSADTRVLYHYLVAKYKPRYNNDVVSELLTINIPEATSLLREPERGTL